MNTQVELDSEYMKEIVYDFDKRAPKGQWLTTWGEDGSFEVVSREKHLAGYVEQRLSGCDAEEFIIDYRGWNTFKEAKQGVVAALHSWSEQIKHSVKQARALRKP